MDRSSTLNSPGDQQAAPTGNPQNASVSEAEQVGWSLEQGKRLAEAGESARAKACLEGILVPVLDRPWVLKVWMGLIRLLEPAAERPLREALLNWVMAAKRILEERSSPSEGEEGSGELLSQTLARLYWNQGHRDKALEIYRGLLQSDPQDVDLLQEFQKRLGEAQDVHDTQPNPLRILEEWALRIQRRKGDLAFAHHEGTSSEAKKRSRQGRI